VPGMTGGVAEYVDHDVEQLHFVVPPGHVTRSVDGQGVDCLVRVCPDAPV
jgi:hypothetical protein